MSRQFLAISLLTFINVLGFSLMIPVFPFIVDRFGGHAITYGFLLSSYSTFQLLGAPLLGSLGDKYGRRTTLLISQIVTLIGWIIFASSYFLPVGIRVFGLSLPLFVIILSRMIDGSTGGSISIINAYVADITKSHEKTKAFGLLSTIFGIGYLFGPVLGAYTSSFTIGYLGTVFLALGISLVTLLYIWRYLPESLPPEKRAHDLKINILHEINVFAKLIKLRANTFIYKLFFIRLFYAFAFVSYIALVVLYVKDAYKLSQHMLGTLYLVLGIFVLINQLYLTKKFADSFGELKTFYIGVSAMTFGLATIAFTSNLWIFLLVTYITMLGISMSMITFKSLLTNNIDERRQGEINGVDESIMAGASALGPLAFGYIYEQMYHFAFLLIAILLVVPHGILWIRNKRLFLREPQKKQEAKID